MTDVEQPRGPTRRFVDRQARVADVLADVLVSEGVELVFGIPGGPIAPLNDALLDRKSIRSVTTRHENSAMFAAASYARTSGKLGVVLVTSGPGVLNAMTGLATAWADGAPVLLIVGEVPRSMHGKGALQDGSAHHLNILGMTRSLAKLAVEIPDAHAAPTMLRRACATAMSGRRGPVVVIVPMDALTAHTAVPEVAQEISTEFAIPPRTLAKVGTALSRSQRAVIFAGSGMRHGDAPARLVEVAEHLQLPVMTTPKGKGVFPESHRLSLGVFGMGGHPSTRAFLEEGVETVLALGTSLGDLATDGWSHLLKPTRDFIHVDIDAAQVGRSYEANLAIVAPAEQFLDGLLRWMPRRIRPRTYGIRHHADPAALGNGESGRILPARAVWEVQQVMPPHTIYTVDSGEHYFFATHYLKIDHPDGFIVMTGLGSMGSSVGGAIGARLARPGRPVAVICGDGGFAMVAGEIATAAAEGLPIAFFVMNDERLGMVEHGNNKIYGRSPEYSTGPMDVAALGRALGARGLTVAKAGELASVDVMGELTHGPLVVDIQIDRHSAMPKNGRFATLGKVASSVN